MYKPREPARHGHTAASLFTLACVLCMPVLAATEANESLATAFQNPPHSARPHTWWHWMNGNITQEGIKKDLEWMNSIGLGGVQNFNVSLNTPRIVEKPLDFMTPEWKDAFRYAVSSASEQGLDFAIAASPGWSETGGPWVKPEEGMKKLVWSEVTVEGGQLFAGKLPAPPSVTGPFQDMEAHDPLAMGDKPPQLPAYYSDALVLAFPVASAALPIPAVVDHSGKPMAAEPLVDGELGSVEKLVKGDGGQTPAVIYSYREPVTIRSATLYVPHAKPPFREAEHRPVLEVEEGNTWRKLAELPLSDVPTTVAIPATTGKRFRLRFAANEASPDILGEGAPGTPKFDIFATPDPGYIEIGEWKLSAENRVHRFETKAGFAVTPNYYELGHGGTDKAMASPEQVVDLSSRVAKDGTLQWQAPAGTSWRVLRLGYSLTGKTNHPAPAEATGLEVDKYDGKAVRKYLETYLAMYREAVGPELIGHKGVNGMLTDSIEVGAANWTAGMVEKFRALRGYDPTPWLPVLTGAVIGSAEQSEAFLYDFRRTLADLLATEHYATVAEVARQNDLTLYGEALEDGRPVIGDDLAMRAHASVPMAALWNFNRGTEPRHTLLGDMKGAASVAHIYGQNIVAAESMTAFMSPWAFAPADLKRLIDLEFVYGVNRPVIHTSVHHPEDDKLPGLSLMIFGQYFNRHETWAPMAKPWVDYMARSSLLLQDGRYFADVAYFYGEEAPITALFKEKTISNLPTRYAYDFVNADIVKSQLAVKDGDLVAASGARFKVLYLGGTSSRMTLGTLNRIAELVKAGATVVGMPPTMSPALGDDPQRFKAAVEKLWAGTDMTNYGKGKVYRSSDSEAVLAQLGVAPDFDTAADAGKPDVLFLHRRLDDGDIYFLTNRKSGEESFEAKFRVVGKQPELWNAIDGSIKALSYRVEGDTTVVPLQMNAEDAFFVVFRAPTAEKQRAIPAPEYQVVATIESPWAIHFQPGRGAPESLTVQTLAPLDKNEVDGIRYFSGIASYHTNFELPENLEPGEPIEIDLGKVGDVAEVYINGRKAGTSWFPPYRLAIGDFVQQGVNTLEVRVANLWVNQLIGDAQPGAKKMTFVAAPTYVPDAPLRPSGLIGPVKLIKTAE